MKLLNSQEGKVSKIKKEGQPNFLYLGKPEVTSQDIITTKESSSQIAKSANTLLDYLMHDKSIDTFIPGRALQLIKAFSNEFTKAQKKI